MHVAAPHLVKEQGCGRKGQGAPEHLWAFMAQLEACFEGDVPDGEDSAGAYALGLRLFADIDVARAYGQVWRDGMCLALYSMHMGVRGPMWRISKQWLDGATACTSWNGVHGRAVQCALQKACARGVCSVPSCIAP